MSWRIFIRSHAHVIADADFFTTEVRTARGLVTYYTLLVIDIATRRVCVAGTTTNPTSAWMEQIARNLTECETGFLIGKRYLILDRDALYSHDFKQTVTESGVEIVRIAIQAPNMNAYAERFVRSIKTECLDRMIFVGEDALRCALSEYVAHYNTERSHQGLGNELIDGEMPSRDGVIDTNELGWTPEVLQSDRGVKISIIRPSDTTPSTPDQASSLPIGRFACVALDTIVPRKPTLNRRS